MKKILNSESKFFAKFISCILIIIPIVFLPYKVHAEIVDTEINDEIISASSEFLRDLDYETWQLVAYKSPYNDSQLILRVIGYPGSLRIDHPLDLNVDSGRKNWILRDKTPLNQDLLNDKRQAAAEFDLEELIDELTQNRPLRLSLSGVFSELPVPPFLVKEWRSLK